VTELSRLDTQQQTGTGGNGPPVKPAPQRLTQILEAAGKDKTCTLWISLRDVLPWLAEAAPAKFLDAVGSGLKSEMPLLRRMFNDHANGRAEASASAYISLLSALETCAWSPMHFGPAVDLLARLVAIDPGGRLAIRPAASLRAIFDPWQPQTSARGDDRLAGRQTRNPRR